MFFRKGVIMCNIAGYVGSRPAAPILIEMIRRQEGLAGGYYTGLATIHEGKLYYTKLTGDTDRLVAMTEASKLPGTIGIIHSRSKSGGGDLWAHPFVGFKEGVPDLAYVANGTAGFGKGRTEEYSRLAERLMAEGYPMPSKVVDDNPRYQKLSDGSTVHMSDVMCQLIQRNLDRGSAPVEAITDAFCEMPSEIVGLILTLSHPDRIVWSRINYPMTVAFAAHGAYLSSAALAMPKDCGEVKEIPANCAGEVFADRYTVVPYKNPPATVAPITAQVRAKAYEAVVETLKQVHPYSDLTKLVQTFFDPADCCPRAMLTYDILYALHRKGILHQEIKRVEGAIEGLDAPKLYFKLK
ncbi:MAG: hypothetical protein IJC19_02610 [Clostridia bacterium]|nr:hypothetical protein [Clostridia bacterium]